MAWILGIDEAGYGPNLGPFVMTAVACRVPDAGNGADLWELLAAAVRRAADGKDDRLVVDDSKEVYGTGRGLAGLERGVAALGGPLRATLAEQLAHLCPEASAELTGECWYTGTTALPVGDDDHAATRDRFATACDAADVRDWQLRSVVVCPPRFNELIDRHDSKAAVVAEGFIALLRWAVAHLAGEPLVVVIDKQGGRNTYSAQIQQALTAGMVFALEERAAISRYHVVGLDHPVELTFQPRADATCFNVAASSMASKYLRELFMGEFNAFWQKHVPGLKPTAGYPGDAARYLVAIRGALETLKIREDAVWRKR